MPVSMNNTQVVFNDTTAQTTAGVTSIVAGTGISSSGGLTPTIANTGVTSIVAGTGISISGGTGAVTITNSQPGAVSSVNGQTGAITDTTLDAIGSVVFAANVTTSNTAGGATIAGSNLRYPSTIVTAGSPITQAGYFTEGNNNVYPQSYWVGIIARRINDSNTAFQNPGNSTALSGTWRSMGGTGARSTFYDAGDNRTISQCNVGLFVRVS
jgi:hypothetical protein